MRLVASVDDRPATGGGRRNALPDVLGALREAECGGLRGLQHLARATDELAGDQERQQHIGDAGELARPHDQVVLMAAIRVAGRVGVVLEQIDVAADAFVGEPLLGVDEQVFQHPLAGTVVGDQLHQAVAFGGGIFRMAAHVEVQPCAVAQENVGAATPGDHPAEQVAGHLVRRQASMTVECAGDTEFGLDAHNPPLHNSSVLVVWATGAEPPPRVAPKISDGWRRLRVHPGYSGSMGLLLSASTVVRKASPVLWTEPGSRSTRGRTTSSRTSATPIS